MSFAVPFKRNKSASENDAVPTAALPPYTPPEDWTGLPSQAFWLETLRQGVDLGRIDLPVTREFLFVGRAPLCDLVLDHASVSRFHAVLQFDRRRADGFAVYDLGSTHGTFVNKERILPHLHIKVNIGDFVRFGESLRVYVVGGIRAEVEKTETPEKIENTKTKNLAARVKAVRRWIEEFEVDLEIQKEQVTPSLWETQLHIGSLSEIFGEGGGDDCLRCTGRGSGKKESEAAAMANLYEILLQQGYLREEDPEDEDQDYYYEEENQTEKKKKTTTVETFQSLSAKHKDLSDRIGSIERAIAERKKDIDNSINDCDEIDRIMAELKANEAKGDLVKLQAELSALTEEFDRVSRLLEIARPSTRVLDRLFLPASTTNRSSFDDNRKESVVGDDHSNQLYDIANEEWNLS